MGLSLLDSCCWMSLRTVSIIIGIIFLLLSTLYMLMAMTYGIMYVHRRNSTSTEKDFRDLVEMMTYDYVASVQIVFSVFFVYGCIKEISCFTLSWIICQIGIIVTSLIQFLFLLIVRFYVYLDDGLLVVLLGISLYIVYSYYDKMKKPQAI